MSKFRSATRQGLGINILCNVGLPVNIETFKSTFINNTAIFSVYNNKCLKLSALKLDEWQIAGSYLIENEAPTNKLVAQNKRETI